MSNFDTRRASILEEDRRQVDYKKAYQQIMGTPIFNMRADFDKFMGTFEKAHSGRKISKEVKEKMHRIVRDGLSLMTDFHTGKLAQNCVFMERAKYVSALAAFNMPAILDTYNIGTVADLSADQNWMRAFRTLDMRDSMAGEIVNFYLHAKIVELGPQKDVPYSHIGTLEKETVASGRVGGGFTFDLKWLRVNGFIQLNDAIMALREQADITKSQQAYTAMVGNMGDTQAFDTDAATTFNRGYQKITETNRTANGGIGKGYGITATTQILLYHHPHHISAVNKAIFATRGENGTNPVVEYNLVPIPSFEVPKQLQESGSGTAHDAVMMVLPGRRILHVPQDNPSENQAFDWDKGVMKVGMQDFYKMDVKDDDQLLKVRLGA